MLNFNQNTPLPTHEELLEEFRKVLEDPDTRITRVDNKLRVVGHCYNVELNGRDMRMVNMMKNLQLRVPSRKQKRKAA